MKQLSFAMEQVRTPLKKMWFFIAFRDTKERMVPFSKNGKLIAFVSESDAHDNKGGLGVVAPRQYGTLGDLLQQYKLSGIEVIKPT